MTEAGPPGGSAKPPSSASDLPGSDLDPALYGETTIRRMQASIHAGPLPSPALMRAYEDQHPGAASWILAEAEKSADHNRAMQRIALKTGSRDALLHRLLPFFVVLSLICASVLIAIFASAWLGGATFAASLGAVMLDYFKRQSRR